MDNHECFICKKHKGEIQITGGAIFEDDIVYVGHIGSNEKTVYLGYLIIDLKRHVSGLGEMTDREARTIGEILNQVSKALKVTRGEAKEIIELCTRLKAYLTEIRDEVI